MIRVSKPKSKAPQELEKKNRAGKTERERAMEFYADPANANKKFEFEAYGDKEVRRTLNEIFHFKCAYCEVHYGASQPVAVEHYRPKGMVEEEDGSKHKPGYYWLAADWDNLLPSCTDCNSPRYHRMGDGQDLKLGKGNRFPLDDPRRRADAPGRERQEKRQLIHPCRDRPESHLEFLDQGLVRPRQKRRGESEKGRMSIDVYALQRPQLVQARKLVWLDVMEALDELRELVELISDHPADERLSARFQRKARFLKDKAEPERPFSGMVRQLLDLHLPAILS